MKMLELMPCLVGCSEIYVNDCVMCEHVAEYSNKRWNCDDYDDYCELMNRDVVAISPVDEWSVRIEVA